MLDSQLPLALEAFDRAIRLSGSQSALAKICDCTPGNISQLVLKGRPLSTKFVLKVEAATGISRHDLRPDIYPREDPSHSPETEHPNPALVHPRGTGGPVAHKAVTQSAPTRDQATDQPAGRHKQPTDQPDLIGTPAR